MAILSDSSTAPLLKLPLVLVVCTGISACASLTTGSMQEVAIQTVYEGNQVFGASCTVKNDRSDKTLTTPGKVLVDKSIGSLEIKCSRNGFPDGLVTLESRTGGEVFGNILLGGVIGAGLDIGSGSAYKYNYSIIVELGKSLHLQSDITQNGDETSSTIPGD